MDEYYKYIVLETYPDGSTWTHWFVTKEDAEWAVLDMQAVHKGRKYEIRERVFPNESDTIENKIVSNNLQHMFFKTPEQEKTDG